MTQRKGNHEFLPACISTIACVQCLVPLKITVVADIPVKIVKEAEQIEPELDEALLLVLSQRTEDLCRVKHVLSIHDPFNGKAKIKKKKKKEQRVNLRSALLHCSDSNF